VRGRVLEPVSKSDTEMRLLAFVEALGGAVHLGIAQNALDDGVEYVRHHSRPWIDANVATAAEDPLTVRRYGELVSRVHALQEMLGEFREFFTRADAESVLTLSGEFHAFARRTSVEVASSVIELGGTSAADDRFAFDRHWRNARALTLHVDVREIDRALGAVAPHEGAWPSATWAFAGLAERAV
jgi:alkylation response protein AidB-like acyl-CoA dehydrogenase